MIGDELELSTRAVNALRRAHISSVQELLAKSRSELLKVRGLGGKTLKEIEDLLLEQGLQLSGSPALSLNRRESLQLIRNAYRRDDKLPLVHYAFLLDLANNDYGLSTEQIVKNVETLLNGFEDDLEQFFLEDS